MSDKKQINEYITEIKHEIDDQSIENIIELLQKIEKENKKYNNIIICLENDYDGYSEINIYGNRDETGLEESNRIEEETRIKNNRLKIEETEYLRLKEKFEGDK